MTKQVTAEIIQLKTGEPADLSSMSIDELRLSINKKFMKIDKIREDLEIARVNAASREQDLTIQLGLHLLELKRRVEDGEVGDEAALTWWEWYADNFPHGRTRRRAEQCMAAASAANPLAHRQAEKEAQRERMRAHRDAARNANAKPEEYNFRYEVTKHAEPVLRNAPVASRPVYQLVDPPQDIDHEKIDRMLGILETCNSATICCFADEFYKFMRDR